MLLIGVLTLPYSAVATPGASPPGRGGPVAYNVEYAPGVRWSGVSGALRAAVVLPGAQVELPLDWGVVAPPQAWYRWVPMDAREHATRPAALTEPPSPATAGAPRLLTDGGVAFAPQEPGAYTLEVAWAGGARHLEDAVLLVQRAAAEQRGNSLNGYRIGSYPSGGGRYAPPAGFIEVTPANQHVNISRNFTLGQFLTKDQAAVWPKYVLIDPLLLEKLELVLVELRAMGVTAERMHVMSGYRTPQYNVRGVGSGGRAALSRHQYGDAADVWIETLDRPGQMSDLNGDGRIDSADARVILAAVDRVEARYPHLVGGAGVYAANSAHPPFVHIDVRGQRARW